MSNADHGWFEFQNNQSQVPQQSCGFQNNGGNMFCISVDAVGFSTPFKNRCYQLNAQEQSQNAAPEKLRNERGKHKSNGHRQHELVHIPHQLTKTYARLTRHHPTESFESKWVRPTESFARLGMPFGKRCKIWYLIRVFDFNCENVFRFQRFASV